MDDYNMQASAMRSMAGEQPRDAQEPALPPPSQPSPLKGEGGNTISVPIKGYEDVKPGQEIEVMMKVEKVDGGNVVLSYAAPHSGEEEGPGETMDKAQEGVEKEESDSGLKLKTYG